MDNVYHRRDFIITVITIFLSLGIGILIGASLSDNIIVKQQKEIVERMENQLAEVGSMYKSLEEKNNVLINELAFWDDFQNDLLPGLINNHLKDLKVALIYDSNNKDILKTIEFLEMAGADAYTTCVYVERLKKQKEIEVSGQKFNLNNGEEKKNFFNLMSEGIINYMVKGEDSDLIGFLKENHIIEVRGGKPGALAKVIYISGSMAVIEDTDIDKSFISLLKESELDVIEVISSSPGKIELDYLTEGRIMAVDNIDSIYGKLALIRMLAGRD